MKTISFIIGLSLTNFVFGQLIFSSQPGIDGKDASLGYHDGYNTSSSNYGNDVYLKAFCMPGAQGGVNINRGLLEFDLSQIPENVQIISATIELFGAGFINQNAQGHYGQNQLIISKLNNTWIENNVTWNNAPAVSQSEIINLPASTSFNQDYQIDVSNWVEDNLSNQVKKVSLQIALQSENPNESAGVFFFSSDYSLQNKRPKITVVYKINNVNENQVCFKNEGENDLDVSLGYHDGFGTSSTNYSNDIYLKAFCLDGAQGGVNTNRGLLYFDLSSIPSNSIVTSATLNLKSTGYINDLLPGHFGQNTAYLRKVTEPWNLNTVTWDNQPQTTTSQQVLLTQSTSSNQNYLLNVLPLVEDMIEFPSTNYGFKLQLQTESPSAALTFHSSNSTDPNLRPELCVEYRINDLSVISILKEKLELKIYPNPTHGKINIEMFSENNSITNFQVIDIYGKTIQQNELKLGDNSFFEVDISNFEVGQYFIRIFTSNGEVIERKITKF